MGIIGKVFIFVFQITAVVKRKASLALLHGADKAVLIYCLIFKTSKKMKTKKFFAVVANCAAVLLFSAAVCRVVMNLISVFAAMSMPAAEAYDAVLQAWGMNWVAGIYALVGAAFVVADTRRKLSVLRWCSGLGLLAMAFFGIAIFWAALASGHYWQLVGMMWFTILMATCFVIMMSYYVRTAVERLKTE